MTGVLRAVATCDKCDGSGWIRVLDVLRAGGWYEPIERMTRCECRSSSRQTKRGGKPMKGRRVHG
jgi:hypothetical protein